MFEKKINGQPQQLLHVLDGLLYRRVEEDREKGVPYPPEAAVAASILDSLCGRKHLLVVLLLSESFKYYQVT